jgi:hypothetical protein
LHAQPICCYPAFVSDDWFAMSDDEEREERTKQFLLDEARRAIALRTKDREFHGLERDFLYLQARMLVEYGGTKDIQPSA